MAGASKIIAVDVNPAKFEAAVKLGATDCVDSSSLPEDKTVQQYIAGDMTPWGVDYSFDATGNVEVMRAALECAHRGWGTSCVIGVAASGKLSSEIVVLFLTLPAHSSSLAFLFFVFRS